MTDKFVRRRGRLSEDRFELVPSADGGAVDDFHSFGWLRGVRERASMLELRKKSGNVLAVAYSWIERVEFDPTEGIILRVRNDAIRIKGRNLNAEVRPEVRLFRGIARHRIAWVEETESQARMSGPQLSVVIDEIAW
jgi:hypothetical protein